MYLISYDLSKDRLRNQVAKEMENFGKRVQYSVFECRISEKQLYILYERLAKIMQDEPDGSIRIYSICRNCEEKLQTIGIDKEVDGMTLEEEGLFIV